MNAGSSITGRYGGRSPAAIRRVTRFAAYWRRQHTLDESQIGHVPPELAGAIQAAGLDPHDIDNIEPTIDLSAPAG